MKNNFKSLGEKLRNIREEAGLTLKEVSKQIIIDTSLLAKIERNERQPTKQIIKQIAKYFNKISMHSGSSHQ